MKRIRPLGYLEEFCARLHDDCDGGLLCVASMVLQGEIDVKKFIDSLYAYIHHESILRLVIQKDDQGIYYFAQKDEGNHYLITNDKDINRQTISEVIERELNLPLDASINLWRIRYHLNVNGKHYIIFTGHHSIWDGIGIASFFNEWQKHYKGYYQSHKPCYPELASPIELLLPIDSSKRVNPLPVLERKDNWLFAKTALLSDRKMKIDTIFIEKNRWDLLVAKIKTNGLTINAFLLAAFVYALSPILPQKKMLALPVNARPDCQPSLSPSQLGLYITTVPLCMDKTISMDNFWDQAALMYAEFKNVTPLFLKGQRDFSIKAIDAALFPYLDVSQNSFLMDFSLTNIGLLPFHSFSNELHLDSFHFFVSNKPGQVGIIASACGYGDVIQLGISYATPIIDVDSIKRLKESMATLITELV